MATDDMVKSAGFVGLSTPNHHIVRTAFEQGKSAVWSYKGPKREMPDWLRSVQMDYARIVSPEEAELMGQVRTTTESIAEIYRERLKRELDGKPESEHPAICARIQREFLDATAPLMKAAGDALAVMPLTFVARTPEA